MMSISDIFMNMRTLVDIPDRQLADLSAICRTRKLSRAEAVRQAIGAFIERNQCSREAAFGLWKGQVATLPGRADNLPEDGLAYQEALRSEW